jgi:hypothetical protein
VFAFQHLFAVLYNGVHWHALVVKGHVTCVCNLATAFWIKWAGRQGDPSACATCKTSVNSVSSHC